MRNAVMRGLGSVDDVLVSRLTDALRSVKAGRIEEFRAVRDLMDQDGWIDFQPDQQNVDYVRRELGISHEELQAWRVQYDALLPTTNK